VLIFQSTDFSQRIRASSAAARKREASSSRSEASAWCTHASMSDTYRNGSCCVCVCVCVCLSVSVCVRRAGRQACSQAGGRGEKECRQAVTQRQVSHTRTHARGPRWACGLPPSVRPCLPSFLPACLPACLPPSLPPSLLSTHLPRGSRWAWGGH